MHALPRIEVLRWHGAGLRFLLLVVTAGRPHRLRRAAGLCRRARVGRRFRAPVARLRRLPAWAVRSRPQVRSRRGTGEFLPEKSLRGGQGWQPYYLHALELEHPKRRRQDPTVPAGLAEAADCLGGLVAPEPEHGMPAPRSVAEHAKRTGNHSDNDACP
jgi:hypothetical protein